MNLISSRLQSASSLTIQIKHRYKSVNTIQNALPSPVRYFPIELQGHLYYSTKETYFNDNPRIQISSRQNKRW